MLQNLDHIALVVEDLEDALGVYRDVLGLSLDRIEEIPAEQVRVAFLPLLHAGSKIELIQPTSEDSGVARFLAKRGEGVHHICLVVDDIEVAMNKMAANGLEVLDDIPRVGNNGQKYIFIHPRTTHGLLLELYEKPKND